MSDGDESPNHFLPSNQKWKSIAGLAILYTLFCNWSKIQVWGWKKKV